MMVKLNTEQLGGLKTEVKNLTEVVIRVDERTKVLQKFNVDERTQNTVAQQRR